jgi:hypothetical protein
MVCYTIPYTCFNEVKKMEPTGKCKVCTINLWANNRPMIFPCGINQCPYETASQQASIQYERERSIMGSGLAQAMENMT